MSNKLVRAVRDDRTIDNPLAKWLLSILADHCNNETGLCCPSIKTLQAESAMSHGAVTNSLRWLKDHGKLQVKSGGGKGNPANHYSFPGLQGSPPDGLPNGDQGSPRHGLPLDTHGNKNGAVESVKVVHQMDQGSPPDGHRVVHHVDSASPPRGHKAEEKQKLKPKEASAAAKEPSASAVAAEEPFAPPTDQSSHGITEKWIESLKSKYPKVNGEYVQSKCKKWCEDKRKPFTPEIFEKFLATEHQPKPKTEPTKQSENKKKPEKSDKPKKVSPLKVLDIEILTSAINENILSSYSPGIKSCETGISLTHYLRKQFPGISPLSILYTAKERGFWKQCGFDKFYRLPEKEKDIQKLNIVEIVDGWE